MRHTSSVVKPALPLVFFHWEKSTRQFNKTAMYVFRGKKTVLGLLSPRTKPKHTLNKS